MRTTTDPGASDERAREAALDVARSFIVQAPAGSGKTELLIQRYLALLPRVERPEAILAMTFTRKAAGEMRERIVAALRAAAASPAPAEPHEALTWRLARAALDHDAAHDWNLIAHPSRLQVQTIDAFCAALMRQAPLALKLGALPRFAEQATALYVEAARVELDSAGADDTAWRRLLEHVDNDADRAIALIAAMLGKREQWLRHVVTRDVAGLRASLEDALTAEIEGELAALTAAIPDDLVAPLLELARYAASNLELNGALRALAVRGAAQRLPPPPLESLPHWRSLAQWLLSANGGIRHQINVRQGFPPRGNAGEPGSDERRLRKTTMEAMLADLASVPGLAAALDVVRRLPPPCYDDDAWLFVAALLEILPRCAARLRLVFAQAGTIDFTEATLVALQALGDPDAPSDLLLKLDMQLDHLLVDEFQDTSTAQADLIDRLTAGWTRDDGRTLFVVGDPMQSIYRFREADVSIFLDAQRQRRVGGVPVELVTLLRNFRSQGGLVDWVNATFPKVLSARDEPQRAAVAFRPAMAARERGIEEAMTFDACANAVGEARTVVARVRSALAGGADSIAVLVRKRADLSEILPALRAAGIAYAAVELDRLTERQAMLDLASLTHALIQPDDRLAWLASLRAPWCGLALPDQFALDAACAGRSLCEMLLDGDHVPALSDDGRFRLGRYASVVGPALRQRGRVPLVAMVRGAWLALGGPACASESIDRAAAHRFFSLLGEHASGADIADWNAFAQALRTLYAQADDALTRVRVMTLHRAKGLEFDVVIMPGLGKRPRSGEAQLLLWRERRERLLLAPMKARSARVGDDDLVYAYLRALASDEDAAELGRLLYVGCTRARQRLHLTAVLDVRVDRDGAAQWLPPQRGTALAALWAAVSANANAPDAGAMTSAAVARPPGVPLRRLTRDWRLPAPPPSIPIASGAIDKTVEEAVEFDWARESARQLGIVAHRIFFRVAKEGIDAWGHQRIADQRPRISRELGALGFTRAEIDAAAGQVVQAVTTCLSDARGRWLFDRNHVEQASEYRLTFCSNGAFEHVVLDRTFVDADGTRWIVDFKLSRHEGGDTGAFLDRERLRYRGQLENYAHAMRALDARPIRVGLYFPLLAGWREWEGAG